MSITVTLIVQGLAFLAVAWLVMRFGWPEIMAAIEAAKRSAQAEGARIVIAAREEVATETGRAREQLRKDFGTMVVSGASRLLEREVDAKAHTQLIDKLADEIARG